MCVGTVSQVQAERNAELVAPTQPGREQEGPRRTSDTEEDQSPLESRLYGPPGPLPESDWGSSPGASWLARASWASSWVW